MTERYYLNRETLPTIPVPHDCIIDKITLENDLLVFTFEQDISYHASIQHFKPDAKSLVIKYHLIDDFRIYEYFAENKCWNYSDSKKLTVLTANRTEYINHFVSYKSMIIDLCAERSVRLEIEADYIEYEWK